MQRILMFVLLFSLFSLQAATVSYPLIVRQINVEDGLSQSTVYDIFQDSYGFIWVATESGINRYDGHEFAHFSAGEDMTKSVAANMITSISEDVFKKIWIGTFEGISIYDPLTAQFTLRSKKMANSGLISNQVSSILQHSNGTMWVATYGGLHHYVYEDQRFTPHLIPTEVMPNADQLARLIEAPDGKLIVGTQNQGVLSFDPQSQKYELLFHFDQATKQSNNEIRALFFDEKGALWIGTNDGLFIYDYKSKKITTSVFEQLELSSAQRQRVRSVAQDKEGQIWVSIYGDGILSLDPRTFNYRFYGYIPSIRHGLNGDSIGKLMFDRSGLLWIGTEGYGVNIWDPVSKAFDHVVHRGEDPNSLSNNVVWTSQEDWNGNLWIGTDHGLNRVSKDRKSFTRYDSSGKTGVKLISDLVYNVAVDEQQKAIWVATSKGVMRLDVSSGEVNSEAKVWQHDEQDPLSLSHDFIYDIELDEQRQLWIATPMGLDRLEVDNGLIHHYQYDANDKHSLTNFTAVTKLFIDPNKDLWIGTDNGLNRYDRQQDRFDRFLFDEGAPVNAEIMFISSIAQVKPEELWVGYSGDGIRILDFSQDITPTKIAPKVSRISLNNGLPTNLIFGIIPEPNGRVWLSTMNGLMLYDTQGHDHRFFGAKEGLLGSEFNDGAYYVGKDGILYFGSTNGLALIDPKLIPAPQSGQQLEFIELVTYINQSSSVQPLLQKQQVDVPYDAHAAKIKFSDLNYYASRPTQYAYQLDSQEGKWIEIGNDNSVTLNNLAVGSHQFNLKHKSSGGAWVDTKTLHIIVIPPWWRTTPAYLLYFLLLMVAVFFLVNAQGKKIMRERALNLQLKQVDRLKDEFLANTSHELRTPLNGIIGLAESLLDGVAGELPSKARHNLAMVVSSGKRLANMVNDILDFSKLKDKNLSLHMKAVDLHALVDVVMTLSRPMTADKALHLVNDVPKDLPPAHADEDRLQQILDNLLSNAIKFSDKGEVRVFAEQQGELLLLGVSDTGIGIEPDKLDSIFESFEKAESDARCPLGGAGLGLALSKRLVELHGGEIRVESTPNAGTCFYFSLMISDEQIESSNANAEMLERIHTLADDVDYDEYSGHQTDIECNRFRILLVDDEPINRRVLYNHLSVQHYQLIEAASGEEALLAMEMNGPFDLILLDIMMPHMSGYEVCEKLREKYLVSDLAIIFLTAKNQVADLVQSFAVGANDYLTKPVAKHELLSRVEMHLKVLDIHRNLERKVEERTIELEQSNKSITALSKICTDISAILDMNKLMRLVYEHIRNLMDVDVFSIGIYDEHAQRIDFKLAIENGEDLPMTSHSMNELGRPAVWCVQNKKPLITNNYYQDYSKYFGNLPVATPKVGNDAGSLMYWPLLSGEKIIGVLTVQSYHINAYNEHQQDTIQTLASTTAIALDNAKAYREVELKNHEIISAQQQLVQAEKMVSLGSLTAGVAHEINNPTNFVHVSAQNLEVDLARFETFILALAGDDADQEILESFNEQFKTLYGHLATIKDGTERIKIIVQDLRAFTQLDVIDPKTIDITDCLQSTLNLVQTQFLDVAEFETDFHSHPQLLCYPAQLNQVFMNLIVNACDAIREKQKQQGSKLPGKVIIGCHSVDNNLEITVQDNGCGMSEETKSRLFEPFYTTKDVGEGTGLGLSISFGIVNKHKGKLLVTSEVGVGSEFKLVLPL